ncbi:MAG: LysR family transcriptional regulator [Burkholderiales bacterium]|nr:LysR family transcriptional regulator [Burkholderiales bacterium]
MNRPPATRSIDWGNLQYFQAVADSGSLKSAAERLGVNHSTVLRRIAALEGQLGSRLFDRLPGGYALTSAGNELADRLEGLAEQAESAERKLRGLDAAVRGVVRVTSSDVVVEGLLMPLLARFRRRHAQVRIQLVTDYAFAALSRDQADIAVRGADKAPPGLVARQVGHIDSVLCAARRYRRPSASDRDIRHERWVAVDESLAFGTFNRWLRENVAPGQVVMRVDSIVAVADAVEQGVGIGFVPQPLLAARPQLVRLEAPVPALRKPLWVLMHPDVQHTARTRALFDFLADELGASPTGAKARG